MSVDADQLSTMITHAVAPAFLLGAIAALVSILTTRMTGIVDRIRSLNQIADDDTERRWLKEDIARLRRRETLLNQALYLAVTAGICISNPIASWICRLPFWDFAMSRAQECYSSWLCVCW